MMASVSTLPSVASHMATGQASQNVLSNIAKTSSIEDLRTLRQILHQGIDDLLRELETHGRGPPSTRPCTEEEVFDTPVGTRPRRNIVRSCEKIISLVQGPMWWMMQSTGGSTFPAVLDTVIELKLHHIISVDRQAPTSLADLEKESGGSRELICEYLLEADLPISWKRFALTSVDFSTPTPLLDPAVRLRGSVSRSICP